MLTCQTDLLNYGEIIERMCSFANWNKTQLAENVFEISINNLSNRVRQGRLDFEVILTWALTNNINLHWLITGQGTPRAIDGSQIKTAGDGETEYIPALDASLHRRIIIAVENALASEKRQLTPELKSELITVLYDHHSKIKDEPGEETVKRYLRLVK